MEDEDMRTYEAEFHAITSSSSKTQHLTRNSLADKLTNFSQAVINIFKATSASMLHSLTKPNEIRVWKVGDRQGVTYWKAYDPYTDRTSHLSSEDDLRIWLEQRYNK